MARNQKKDPNPIRQAQLDLQDQMDHDKRKRMRQRENRKRLSELPEAERRHKIARRAMGREARKSVSKAAKAGRRCPRLTHSNKPCGLGRYLVHIPQGEGKGYKTYLAPACYAHLTPAEREKYAKAQGQEGGAKPKGPAPKPRVIDALREQVESQVAEILAPLLKALDAEKPIVVGNGAHASVELHPDHRTRILAVQEILDRTYGKPKQTTELSGVVAFDPVEVPTDKKREQEVARILAESGALGTVIAHSNPASQN